MQNILRVQQALQNTKTLKRLPEAKDKTAYTLSVDNS